MFRLLPGSKAFHSTNDRLSCGQKPKFNDGQVVLALALTVVFPALAWRDWIKPTAAENFRVSEVTR
jgi:hypothetical protein